MLYVNVDKTEHWKCKFGNCKLLFVVINEEEMNFLNVLSFQEPQNCSENIHDLQKKTFLGQMQEKGWVD